VFLRKKTHVRKAIFKQWYDSGPLLEHVHGSNYGLVN